jgi:hypothetical protein
MLIDHGLVGAYAEQISVHHSLLLPVPEGFSYDEAGQPSPILPFARKDANQTTLRVRLVAGICVTWPTSFEGLVGRGQLKKGSSRYPSLSISLEPHILTSSSFLKQERRFSFTPELEVSVRFPLPSMPSSLLSLVEKWTSSTDSSVIYRLCRPSSYPNRQSPRRDRDRHRLVRFEAQSLHQQGRSRPCRRLLGKGLAGSGNEVDEWEGG